MPPKRKGRVAQTSLQREEINTSSTQIGKRIRGPRNPTEADINDFLRPASSSPTVSNASFSAKEPSVYDKLVKVPGRKPPTNTGARGTMNDPAYDQEPPNTDEVFVYLSFHNIA